jgi:hypothetical protein
MEKVSGNLQKMFKEILSNSQTQRALTFTEYSIGIKCKYWSSNRLQDIAKYIHGNSEQ